MSYVLKGVINEELPDHHRLCYVICYFVVIVVSSCVIVSICSFLDIYIYINRSQNYHFLSIVKELPITLQLSKCYLFLH